MSASAKRTPKHDERRSVREIAVHRRNQGLRIADRFDKIAQSTGNEAVLKMRDKLRACANSANIFLASDLHDSGTGELYDGTGNLIHCRTRFCPSCTAAFRRRSRRKVRAMLESVRSLGRLGLRWRFVTLTGPRADGLRLTEKITVYQIAWALLRKRLFWKRLTVQVGCKAAEFVPHDEGDFHFHFHVLLLSRWIAQTDIAAEWTHCLRRAYQRVGRVLPVAESAFCVVDVRAVKPKLKSLVATAAAAEISLESAITETLKYVTKCDCWLKIPDSQLAELAEIRRWPRFFEVLSSFRNLIPSVHPTRLSDGGDGNALCRGSYCHRSRCHESHYHGLPYAQWKAEFHHRIESQQFFRRRYLSSRFPYARFEDLQGRSWTGGHANKSARGSGNKGEPQ